MFNENIYKQKIILTINYKMDSAPTPFDMINAVNESRDDSVKIADGLKLYTNEATPVTPIAVFQKCPFCNRPFKDLKGHINKQHGLVSNDDKILKMNKKVQSLLGLRDQVLTLIYYLEQKKLSFTNQEIRHFNEVLEKLGQN